MVVTLAAMAELPRLWLIGVELISANITEYADRVEHAG